MHMIVNHHTPDEFIVATGETHSVRDLCETVFSKLDMDYREHVVQNKRFMRPEELKYLKGDSSKSRQVLGWRPDYTFESMLEEMIERWESEL
jgi:GDPmannose 4,6-dehydratase